MAQLRHGFVGEGVIGDMGLDGCPNPDLVTNYYSVDKYNLVIVCFTISSGAAIQISMLAF